MEKKYASFIDSITNSKGLYNIQIWLNSYLKHVEPVFTLRSFLLYVNLPLESLD